MLKASPSTAISISCCLSAQQPVANEAADYISWAVLLVENSGYLGQKSQEVLIDVRHCPRLYCWGNEIVKTKVYHLFRLFCGKESHPKHM